MYVNDTYIQNVINKILQILSMCIAKIVLKLYAL